MVLSRTDLVSANRVKLKIKIGARLAGLTSYYTERGWTKGKVGLMVRKVLLIHVLRIIFLLTCCKR